MSPTMGRLPWSESTMDISYDTGDSMSQVLVSCFARGYIGAFLSSPFVTVETLKQVQWWGCLAGRRPIPPDSSNTRAQQKVGEDLPSPSQIDPWHVKGDEVHEDVDNDTVHKDIQPDTSCSVVMEDGVVGPIRQIADKHGWLSLTRGHLAQTLHNVGFMVLQPSMEEVLNDAFDIYDEAHLATYTISHAITSLVLAPFEIIRTRLIASHPNNTRQGQTSLPLLAEEHNLSSLYRPRYLIPTIISHSISAFLRAGSYVLLCNHYSLSPCSFTFKLCRVVALGMEAVLVAPVELARKRIALQPLSSTTSSSQSITSASAIDMCVPASPNRYSSLIDVWYWVLMTEERKSSKRKGWRWIRRMKGLWRGVVARWISSVVVEFGQDLDTDMGLLGVY